MGIEQKAIDEAQEFGEDFSPFLGQRAKPALPYDKLVIHFAVGCLQDTDFCLFADDLMTKSMRCQGTLKKPGDVMVLEQKDTFDKEGNCHMLIKYLEYPGGPKCTPAA